ncbi:ABC transporter ATP-binding protein [Nitrosomonas supralitoralis]|uniref:Spermidine/putrescine import ATP-binding protein PotA n=1 Tax=Nitrosomonas supralitoralis TaxID=2116706 RepID=A0A2P7NT62_9PROT|nr:ABC transporter ATP-binding protein [Nitrosomonas supralitoralis]PSJ16664.1 spermidine/putrescine ABC transporter ATP-binding protein [Nitrosomonas supralitoralis]
MTLLEVRNVTKRFGSFTAVDDVNITIKTGEFFTLLGPSGCGKTTLLRMIAGFDAPDNGQILLDNKDIIDLPPEKRPFHTVFQSYALFSHMTVADNIGFPLKMSGKTSREIKIRVAETLSEVELSSFSHRYPHELSGGQKQRVAFARGLINQPRLLLLDEPLGALDEKLRENMQRELISLQAKANVTFIYVTHAQNEALALSHRIAVMNQGKIEQIDEPSRIYNFPINRFVADFIGKINMLDAQVIEASGYHLKLKVTGLGEVMAPVREHVKIGDQGILAIRPEQVRIDPLGSEVAAKFQLVGKIKDFLYIGDVTTYLIELPNSIRIEALQPNSFPGHAKLFEIGDPVVVSWQEHSAQFLPD